MNPPDPLGSISPVLEKVRDALPDQEIYLVGGAVRDALLGRVSRDLDFALPKGAISIARRVASKLKADFYVLDESFDIARIIISDDGGDRNILDFAAYRGVDLDADLRSRDFTINAIAYKLDLKKPIDPLGGISDLNARMIRASSENSLRDDPVRILRAVRLASAYDLKIDDNTLDGMKKAANLLPGITPERVRDELFKILGGPTPELSLRTLDRSGVFPYLLPELETMKGVEQSAPHVSDVWEHTLKVVQALEVIYSSLVGAQELVPQPDPFIAELRVRLGKYHEQFDTHFAEQLNPDRSHRSLLFFITLYHDVSKPQTKSIDESGRIHFFGHDQMGSKVALERGAGFNLSNSELEYLEKIIKNHMRFHYFHDQMVNQKKEPSRRSIYHFFSDTGKCSVDLVLLGLSDLRGMRGTTLTDETWGSALDIARMLLENYWEKPQDSIAPPRLMDGKDVMREYNLEPGPLVGQLLEAIREGQAMGRVKTESEAVAFGLRWLKKNRK